MGNAIHSFLNAIWFQVHFSIIYNTIVKSTMYFVIAISVPPICIPNCGQIA